VKSYLNIDHVSITFPTDKGPLKVLDDVTLRVNKGEFISLIGHSGCGKSTVLNIVAGLLNATEGCVLLEEREVNEPGPDRAVVFQNHSLLPWLTVYENVRLAVDQVFKKTKSRKERHDWTLHNLELVHMTHALDRRPDEISGGMKQRVGIARALAMEPKVLLMDEPFGALDSLTRTHMQDSLMEIQARLNNTVIMITHDVDEAVLLSDRIVMMTNGPNATVGQILDVDLLRPRNRLELAEDPRYNHYRAEVVKFLHERHAQPDVPTTPVKATMPEPKAGVLDLSEWRERRRAAGGKQLEKSEISLGFIPLTDCAPLVIAKEKGFFAKHGLKVNLSRESSWANVRDKVSVGMLDGAQMLAGMPLAAACGADRSAPMITGLSLDLNGNGITVSNELFARMAATDEMVVDPAGAARALKKVIEQNKAEGKKQLVFATVFPVSSHNYLLRLWLSSAGIDPDHDIRLTVVPPPQMVGYLESGTIAGFCVGEPWNTLAEEAHLGKQVCTSHQIWNNHPEKVFGVTGAWAAANPNTHQAVLKALIEAGQWLDDPANRAETAEILAQGRYVNAPAAVIASGLGGQSGIVFHRHAAGFPWRSHAAWFLTQMIRWGQAKEPMEINRVARSVYRPELYREAAAALGISAPAVDYKLEGVHANAWSAEGLEMGSDAFFDERTFDPAAPLDYLRGLMAHYPSADEEIARLRDANPAWPAPQQAGVLGRSQAEAG